MNRVSRFSLVDLIVQKKVLAFQQPGGIGGEQKNRGIRKVKV